MNDLLKFIIISLLLIPANGICSYWITKELLKLSSTPFGMTSRDNENEFSQFRRNITRHSELEFYSYLYNTSADKVRTEALYKLYKLCHLPGIAAFVFAIYIVIFRNPTIAVIGVCLLAAINLFILFYGVVYRRKHHNDDESEEYFSTQQPQEEILYDEQEYRKPPLYVSKKLSVAIFIAVTLVVFPVMNATIIKRNQAQSQDKTTSESSYVPLLKNTKVYSVLTSQGYETADIPTSYWYISEEKLMYVVAGVKENTKLEYYQYFDDETAQTAYETIWNLLTVSYMLDINKMAEYEKDLKDSGKIIAFEYEDDRYYLLCKGKSIIFAHMPIDSTAVDEALNALGYAVE